MSTWLQILTRALMKNIGQDMVTHGWKCMESVKIEVIATGEETHFKGFNVLEYRQTDKLCPRIVRNLHEKLPSPIKQASKQICQIRNEKQKTQYFYRRETE